MKILLISLLRVGDIFMITPILRRLRELHPESEIDILINDEFSYICESLDEIDGFRLFPRSELKKMMSAIESNLLQPVETIDQLVEEINECGYQKVINLTHNRLSAHLMSLIEADNKVGISYDRINHSSEDANWFLFLNNRFYFEDRHPFHYVDAFYRGSGNSGEAGAGIIKVSDEDRQWAASQLPEEGTALLFQLTSSDEKKMWDADKEIALIEQLTKKNHSCKVLCAPPEESFLRERLGDSISLTACGFSQALALIERARLLFTVDTSIKHLASCSDTQVVELCLGSSDPFETGVLKSGNYILRSNESCAPCNHSADCHRDLQYCSRGFDSHWMFHFLEAVLSADDERIYQLSKASESTVRVSRSAVDSFGMWVALPVGAGYSWKNEFSFLLRRSAYQFLLLSKSRPDFAACSAEWLDRSLSQISQFVEDNVLVSELKRLHADRLGVLEAAQGDLRNFRVGPSFPPTLSREEQLARFSSSLEQLGKFEYGQVMQKVYRSCLDGAQEGSFITLKQVREYLREIIAMSRWEAQVLESALEKEGVDVKRVGALLAASSGEAAAGPRKNRNYTEV